MSTFHIIDDETTICELLSELISELGFKARGFTCPAEYLEYRKSPDYQPPLAIFTDVRMPKMTGFDMIEEIRREHPEQKFVVLSGFSVGEEALSRNVCQFIDKPFQPETIEQVVTSLANCDKRVSLPDFINSCKQNITEELQDMWHCPLDCSDC